MLTTLDNCKSYLNLKTTDDDNFIKQLIKYATSSIEGYCNRKFESQEYVEEVHVVKNKIFTKNYTITEINEILIDGKQINNYKVISSYIVLTDKQVTLTGGYNYPDSTEKIAIITYTAGYESFDLPQELVFAATKLTAFYYKEAREDRLGITSEKLDVMSTNFVTDIPESIIQLIKPYRKVKV